MQRARGIIISGKFNTDQDRRDYWDYWPPLVSTLTSRGILTWKFLRLLINRSIEFFVRWEKNDVASRVSVDACITIRFHGRFARWKSIGSCLLRETAHRRVGELLSQTTVLNFKGERALPPPIVIGEQKHYRKWREDGPALRSDGVEIGSGFSLSLSLSSLHWSWALINPVNDRSSAPLFKYLRTCPELNGRPPRSN